MIRTFTGMLAAVLAILTAHPACAQDATTDTRPSKVVVIPVRSAIDKPALYILRRGLKQAITDKADTVVLDMETPGGRLDVTFDILKALEKFPGKTVTYINQEAISAGALISAGTDEIWFSPQGVIGAAAPVLATGGELDQTMRDKIVSYLKARVRAISEGKGYRGEVISAMIDSEQEFKIGDTVIKPEGELLSLTASEATKEYGDPPHRLLGNGIATSLDNLLDQLHGKGNHSVHRLETSWSEDLAQFITSIAPLLISIGLLGLFIEFKTPGFGFFGIAGLLLLVLVFLGHHLAGLSGHEPVLFMLLGLVLIAVEIFFLPGTLVAALSGAILILGALVWAMLDIWPNEPVNISAEILVGPLLNVMLGVVGAVILFIAMLKFLPGGGIWGKMVLHAAVAGEPGGIRPVLSTGSDSATGSSLVGQSGKAVTNLFPSGQVEIGGNRYEARLAVGFAEPGTAIIVTGISEFGLIVEEMRS